MLYLNHSRCVSVTDHQLKALVDARSDQLKYYYRIQAHIPAEDSPMDDVSPTHLLKLKLEGADLINQSNKLLDEICEKLV